LIFSQQELIEKQIEELKKQVKSEPKQEFINNLEKQYLGRNIAVNQDHDAQQSINKMVSDLEKELGVDKSTNAIERLSVKSLNWIPLQRKRHQLLKKNLNIP
jgi:uncharacterized protein YpuA (DUF1002 family)